MGADQFESRASAKTAEEAFRLAREEARHDYGHRGYTGTIAEKTSWKLVTPNAGESPEECVRRCQESRKHWSDDKWGPAACVDLGPDTKTPGHRIFHFWGVASS